MSKSKRPVWGKGLAVGVASTALLVAAVVVFITNAYTTTEEEHLTLADAVIHAVVEVTLEKGPLNDETFPSNDRWRAAVDDILWDRESFTIVGGVTVDFDLGATFEPIELSIPPGVQVDVDEVYVIGISRAYFSDPFEQAKWPWQYQIGLDPVMDYRPILGTPDALVDELDSLTLDGESGLDALVAFAAERGAVLEARITGATEPETPRSGLLSSSSH